MVYVTQTSCNGYFVIIYGGTKFHKHVSNVCALGHFTYNLRSAHLSGVSPGISEGLIWPAESLLSIIVHDKETSKRPKLYSQGQKL